MQAMADLQPFTGLRYNLARVGDWGSVLAPPYDVVDDAQRRDLISHSPYQITHIETASTNAGIAKAAETLRHWRAARVLEREQRPAYYLLEQRFVHEGRERSRLCLFARARILPWTEGTVLPHEWTMATPKKTRTALRRAARADLSPLLAVVPDRDRRLGSLFDQALQEEPVATGSDPNGDYHRLRVIDQPDAVEALRAALAHEPVYMADGHHRYESALADRDRAAAEATDWTGEEPENFVLMGFVRAGDPGLIVGPTHRLLHIDGSSDALRETRARFEVRDLGPLSDGPERLLRAMTEVAPQEIAFGSVGLDPGRCHLLVATDATLSLLPKSLPASWSKLAVAVLHFILLDPIFGIDDLVLHSGRAVTYAHEAEPAFRAVRNGEARCAFLLNPPPLEQIFATARSGDRMPQKSTYFKPKLPTGAVLYAFD